MAANLKEQKVKKSRKVWAEAEKEEALAVYVLTGNMSKAAAAVGATVNTFKRWLVAADKDVPKVKEAREEARTRFIREAWETVFKGITVGNTMMSFVLENGDKIDKAFEAVANADIDEREKSDLLKVMASLTKIPLRDLAIYVGTVYDKIALATGQPTANINERVDGQVRHEHEHSLTLKQVLEQRRGESVEGTSDGSPADDPLPALLRRRDSVIR